MIHVADYYPAYNMHTQFQQSPIFHLIVIDFAPAHHILGPSPPNSTLLSNFYQHSTPLSIFAHTHIHLLSIVIDSVSTQFLWATTINQLWPTLPMLYTHSAVAWGILCPCMVGVGRIIICHMNHLWSPVPGPG